MRYFKAFTAAGLAAALLASACFLSGCHSSSAVITESYGRQLDQKMQAEDTIFRIPGVAGQLCVVEDEDFGEELEAAAGGLFNITDLETVYVQNPFSQLGIASLTKVMTALLALEYGRLDEEIIIADTGIEMESSAVLCGFEPGDRMRFSSLLSAALIYSGNDAANAVAAVVSGTVSGFVEQMNLRAEELYAQNTHFANPSGLDSDERERAQHYSCVYDLYILFSKCLEFQQFRDIIGSRAFICYYTNTEGQNVSKEFGNTNYYLNGNAAPPDGITILGGKTGHTSSSGYSLIVLARNADGKEYIGVILGASGREALYEQMNLLLQKI